MAAHFAFRGRTVAGRPRRGAGKRSCLMTELSLNEVESLAAKVGRGSGFSWGLAEEIGRGARHLAQGGFPWANALLALAEEVRRLQSPSPSQAERWRKR